MTHSIEKPLTRSQKQTIAANERFGVQFKQNVYQLASLARRIPRVVRRNTQRLMKKRKVPLTSNEVNECRFKIAGAQAASGLLNQALIERNIGGLPYRDCTPHLERAPGHKTPMPIMRVA